MFSSASGCSDAIVRPPCDAQYTCVFVMSFVQIGILALSVYLYSVYSVRFLRSMKMNECSYNLLLQL